jgi:hypothetical protein
MGGGLGYGTVISYPELQFLPGSDADALIKRYYVQVSVNLDSLIIDQHLVNSQPGIQREVYRIEQAVAIIFEKHVGSTRDLISNPL